MTQNEQTDASLSLEDRADAYADAAHALVDPYGHGDCPNCGSDWVDDEDPRNCWVWSEIRDAYLAGLRVAPLPNPEGEIVDKRRAAMADQVLQEAIQFLEGKLELHHVGTQDYEAYDEQVTDLDTLRKVLRSVFAAMPTVGLIEIQ